MAFQRCMCARTCTRLCVPQPHRERYYKEPIGAKDHTLAHPVWLDLRGYSPFPSKQTAGLLDRTNVGGEGRGREPGDVSGGESACRGEFLQSYHFAKRAELVQSLIKLIRVFLGPTNNGWKIHFSLQTLGKLMITQYMEFISLGILHVWELYA